MQILMTCQKQPISKITNKPKLQLYKDSAKLEISMSEEEKDTLMTVMLP